MYRWVLITMVSACGVKHSEGETGMNEDEIYVQATFSHVEGWEEVTLQCYIWCDPDSGLDASSTLYLEPGDQAKAAVYCVESDLPVMVCGYIDEVDTMPIVRSTSADMLEPVLPYYCAALVWTVGMVPDLACNPF